MTGSGNCVSQDLQVSKPKPVQRTSNEMPKVDSSDLSQVAVVIPALNEEQSISLVLEDLPNGPLVLVVNNGSTDRTADIAVQYGAQVIQQPERGYGAACLAGISEIKRQIEEHQLKVRVIAFLDGDYSDHPDLLPEIVTPILRGDAEFILGSRLLGEREKGAMPFQSIVGNRLACVLMRLLFKARYTDLGPFRAIEIAALQRLQMVDRNFGWTVEMQIKAARQHLRTREVPVPYRRRVGTSKISGTISGTLKAGFKILYLIFKYGIFDRKSTRTDTS